jgi:AcrR family transcriptional regulator
MAKEPRRSTRRGGSAAAAPPEIPARERIVDALMTLLAEQSYARIGLGEIAEAAGVSLATLREEFGGKLGIVAAFMRRIDLAVLAGGAPDMETGPRDRLFEAEMRRLDALAPYKDAVRGLAASARCDPALACALHRLAARSQKWTLAAAGIDHGGMLGRLGVEGAVMIHAETLRTWLDDDDPDLARTMASLDRSLRRGERAIRFLGSLCSVMPRFAARGRRFRDAGRAARMADGDA